MHLHKGVLDLMEDRNEERCFFLFENKTIDVKFD